MDTIVQWILVLLGLYLVAGWLFAMAFALIGAKKIDPSAAKGTWGFKLMMIPGSMIFWPLLMKRWARTSPPPEEQSAHRKAARK